MFVFTESKQTSHLHWSFPLISLPLSLSLIIKYIWIWHSSLFRLGLGLILRGTCKVPKDVIAQSSESLICLAVYDQHLHISLEKSKSLLRCIENSQCKGGGSKRNRRRLCHCSVNDFQEERKTYRDRLTLIFKPLLGVEVHYLPPRQKGADSFQVNFL